jgi:hypothetical protein
MDGVPRGSAGHLFIDGMLRRGVKSEINAIASLGLYPHRRG